MRLVLFCALIQHACAHSFQPGERLSNDFARYGAPVGTMFSHVMNNEAGERLSNHSVRYGAPVGTMCLHDMNNDAYQSDHSKFSVDTLDYDDITHASPGLTNDSAEDPRRPMQCGWGNDMLNDTAEDPRRLRCGVWGNDMTQCTNLQETFAYSDNALGFCPEEHGNPICPMTDERLMNALEMGGLTDVVHTGDVTGNAMRHGTLSRYLDFGRSFARKHVPRYVKKAWLAELHGNSGYGMRAHFDSSAPNADRQHCCTGLLGYCSAYALVCQYLNYSGLCVRVVHSCIDAFFYDYMGGAPPVVCSCA